MSASPASTGDGDFWELQDVTSWTFTSTAPIPGAPSDLQATRSSASEIDLSWTSNSYNETGFAVLRSTDGVNFTQIGTTTGTTYQDKTVGAAGPYQYRVFAYNGNGNSPSSNTAVVQATPTITWNTPAGITYGTALGASQLDATASVPGKFAYNPAAGTVLHPGTKTLTVQFTPTDTIDYTNASATTSIVVSQATPSMTWSSPSPITYGTLLGSSQLDASASVPGTYVYTPAAGTLLGAGNNQTLSVKFTPTDTTDYTTASATTTINVQKATPTVTWTSPASIVYGTALGAAQLDASASVAGTFAYTPAAGTVLGAGSQTLSVQFDPTDSTDYTNAVASTKISISQATPTITWTSPASITYGTALGSAQLDASASVDGKYAYTPAAGTVLGAGKNQNLSVTFTPTDATDYTNASATTTLTVTQATPAISWTSPASISYGTTLGSAQLDASASVAGTYLYTPGAGTLLGVGKNQTLSVAFTPTDTVDYTNAGATTTITVSQAAPSITWASPASITYGTALGSTQLDASASVAGKYTYTPSAGAIMGAGKNQVLTVSFTPTDLTDYTTTSATTTITVTQATPTVNWTKPASIAYGTALGTSQLDSSASVAGTFSYTPAAGTVLRAGNDQTLSVLFTPTDAIDYAKVSSSTAIDVAPALLTIKANDQTMTYGGALPTLTVSYAGLVNGDTPAVFAAAGNSPPSVSSVLSSVHAGSYPLTVSGASDSDYVIHYAPGTLSVAPAPLTITANDAMMYVGGAVPILTASYTGFSNGDTPASLGSLPTLATTATSASPAGTYPITVAGATSTDYVIADAGGVLTVNPALITLKAVSVKKQLVSGGKAVQVIVLQFSGPLTAVDASNRHNYTLATIPPSHNRKSKNVAVLSAKYKAANNTVVLRTVKKLSLSPPLQLTIQTPGVLDSLGRTLGGSLVATISRKGGKISAVVRPQIAAVPTAIAVDALLEQEFRPFLAWGRRSTICQSTDPHRSGPRVLSDAIASRQRARERCSLLHDVKRFGLPEHSAQLRRGRILRFCRLIV